VDRSLLADEVGRQRGVGGKIGGRSGKRAEKPRAQRQLAARKPVTSGLSPMARPA